MSKQFVNGIVDRALGVCPCCGQTLPPDLPFGLKFSPQQQRIVERVRRAGPNGICSDDLFAFAYKDDPDGGPLSGKDCLYVRVRQINCKLAKVGKVIRAPRGGNGGGATNYVLKDL